MSSFSIHQRTRENQIVKTWGAYNTANVPLGAVSGLTMDGVFFWYSTLAGSSPNLGGALGQIDLSDNLGIIFEDLLPNESDRHDLVFNGEYLVTVEGLGNSTIGAFDRRGNDLKGLAGFFTGSGPDKTGITFDGASYWTIKSDNTFGTTTIEQFKTFKPIETILLLQPMKSYTLNGVVLGGIVFDGEFLVVHPDTRFGVGSTMDLIYIDRAAGDIVKVTTGADTIAANYQNGMTFDGEFIYTLESDAE